MKKISFNLDEETLKQMNWLLEEYNRDTKIKINMTNLLRIAINNEFVSVNLQLIDERETEHCETEWLKNYLAHE